MSEAVSRYSLRRVVVPFGLPSPATEVRRDTTQQDLGYSLQAPAKVKAGATHPDRGEQFSYLNDTVTEYLDSGEPVISIDTKKREPIGEYATPGHIAPSS